VGKGRARRLCLCEEKDGEDDEEAEETEEAIGGMGK